MRIAVTGKQGQVASALIEVGPKLGVEVLQVGRPELDLLSPETVRPSLTNIQPDIIVNAAAYRKCCTPQEGKATEHSL